MLHQKGKNTLPILAVLHKRGRYYLVHFKELFLLDGKDSSLIESDIGRRNGRANLLKSGITQVISNNHKDGAPMSQIKVLPYKEKNSGN